MKQNPISSNQPRIRHMLVAAGGAVVAGAVLTGLSAGVASAAAPTPPTPTHALSAAHPVATVDGQAVRTARSCATPTAHHLACMSLRATNALEPARLHTQAVTPAVVPAGYGPSDLRSAYALTASGSASQTVAIVDAQDDPNAESDLTTYRAQYGLPACTTANGCFRKVNQNGAAAPLPAADPGWAGEISLDIDMVSAICPNCHILLVEANSATMADLGTAVNRAVAMGAKFVSNSYGGGEDPSDLSADSAYFNHPGVAITASSGDSGYGVEYPASSTGVTAVGGTHLVRATSTRGWAETVWNGAGSGCSAYEPKPAVQNVISSCAKRAVGDVSAVADPSTGVAVYQTYGATGWAVYGGTSVASPIIASVYALAGNPGASDNPNTYPYTHTANLYDVTSGSNGTCGSSPLCTAGTGWDGPTGLGTPNGTAAFTPGASTIVTVTNPGNQSGRVGTPISFTVTATGGTAPYTFTATGLPAGLSITSTGIVSGTPTTAGTYAVTVTARDSAARTGSASFAYTISPAGSCGITQLLGNPGFETGTATPWTSTAGVVNANGGGETAHSGTHYAWLNGYGTTHTDTLTQNVTIPAGCSNSTFTFWLHVDSAETTTTTQFDKLTVKIGSTVLATYSNLNKATGYVQKSFPVGTFAGTTQTISFSGTEDSSLQTSFVLDDTAVTTG